MIKIMTKSTKKKGDALQESLPYIVNMICSRAHDYSMKKLFTLDITKIVLQQERNNESKLNAYFLNEKVQIKSLATHRI